MEFLRTLDDPEGTWKQMYNLLPEWLQREVPENFELTDDQFNILQIFLEFTRARKAHARTRHVVET